MLSRFARRTGIAAFLAALILALMSAVPAPAGASVEWKCTGTAVKRCATIYWDRDTDRFQARAKIVDVAGGTDYRVRVTSITIRRFNGSGFVDMNTVSDFDGWHGVSDAGASGFINPCRYPTNGYYAVATFAWDTATTSVVSKRWGPSQGWSFYC